MHLPLLKTILSEVVSESYFSNTGKYSYCAPSTEVQKKCKKRLWIIVLILNASNVTTINQNMKIQNQDKILAKLASQLAMSSNLSEYEIKDAFS